MIFNSTLPIVWYLFSVGLASLDKNGYKNRKGFSLLVENPLNKHLTGGVLKIQHMIYILLASIPRGRVVPVWYPSYDYKCWPLIKHI